MNPLFIETKTGMGFLGLGYHLGSMTERLGSQAVSMFAACTTNERTQELREVYRNVFSGDFSKWISRDRFIDCHSCLDVERQVAELLPHDGMGPKLLKDFNPYEGIQSVTYEEIIDLMNKHLTLDNMAEVEY